MPWSNGMKADAPNATRAVILALRLCDALNFDMKIRAAVADPQIKTLWPG